MIPCHICGKDAATTWVKGFTPAPDSQKMALCAEHNTAQNRQAVAVAWQDRLRGDIEIVTDMARKKAAPGQQLLSVHFSGGGLLSFTCTDCRATENGSLRIEAEDGSLTFIPLLHVREYVLRPLTGDSEQAAVSAASEPAPPVLEEKSAADAEHIEQKTLPERKRFALPVPPTIKKPT
ncbi:hypothetical protein LJC09_00665 [Desulfovibrio sp. OttesenSCG-928-F20]|nr:hypothetical protein [Desulfovibrio sp. OttesenSCG-928-F20]